MTLEYFLTNRKTAAEEIEKGEPESKTADEPADASDAETSSKD